jgi:hypothetical protein
MEKGHTSAVDAKLALVNVDNEILNCDRSSKTEQLLIREFFEKRKIRLWRAVEI